MAIVNYEDEFDLPPIDYDQSKVPKEIKDRSDGVRDAVLGRQNKEFLAQIGEIVSLYAKEAVESAMATELRQDTVETQFDAVQRTATETADWGGEIIVASDGEATLKNRLDRDFSAHTNKINTIAVSVKDFGAKGDGVTDDTIAIQTAVDYVNYLGGGRVIIPLSEAAYMIKAHDVTFSGAYLKDSGGIAVKSNVVVEIHPKAELKVIPNDKPQYNLFRIVQQENAKIIGGILTGDRGVHTGTGGEWGYGIFVSGSKNIELDEIEINDMWGDAIDTQYASNAPKIDNKNLKIGRIYGSNNRRQSVSIESGEKVLIQDSDFVGTVGVNPQAGLDIEPANDEAVVDDVVVERCRFIENHRRGLQIYKINQDVKIKKVTVRDGYFEGNNKENSELGQLYSDVGINLENSNFKGSTHDLYLKGKGYAISKCKFEGAITLNNAEDVTFSECDFLNRNNSTDFIRILNSKSVKFIMSKFDPQLMDSVYISASSDVVFEINDVVSIFFDAYPTGVRVEIKDNNFSNVTKRIFHSRGDGFKFNRNKLILADGITQTVGLTQGSGNSFEISDNDIDFKQVTTYSQSNIFTALNTDVMRGKVTGNDYDTTLPVSVINRHANLKDVLIEDKGAIRFTSTTRPTKPATGYTGFNTETSKVNTWDGTKWVDANGTSV